MSFKETGIVKKIVPEKECGYITPDWDEQDLKFALGNTKIQEGERVSFVIRIENGKRTVTDVCPLDEAGRQGSSTTSTAGRVSTSSQGTSDCFLNPYNFVRFMRPASGGWLAHCSPASHALYENEGLSGYLTCTLETITPLFINNSQPVYTDPDTEHHTYPFFTIDGDPILPASSLRGMLRSVYEAVTNSCYIISDNQTLTRRMEAKEATDLVPARVIKRDGQLKLMLLTGENPKENNKFQKAAWIMRYPKKRARKAPIDLRGLKHGERCSAVLTEIASSTADPIARWEVVSLHGSLSAAKEAARRQRGAIAREGYLYVSGDNFARKQYERFFFGQQQVVELPKVVLQDCETIIADYQKEHENEDGAGLQ